MWSPVMGTCRERGSIMKNTPFAEGWKGFKSSPFIHVHGAEDWIHIFFQEIKTLRLKIIDKTFFLGNHVFM